MVHESERENNMQITHIASFLVFPGKNVDNPPEVIGKMLPLTGPIYSNMLNGVFEKSDTECEIPIRFVMADDGSQNNIVRNMLIGFIEDSRLSKGKALAEKLRDSTNPKSGPALFFILLGEQGRQKKIVLSRFPADQGILAQLEQNTLQMEFIERVFMRNAQSYKAALYVGSSTRGDFWIGKAVDKQAYELANYWIYDFLSSDFETTSKYGTQRFAKAMRDASRRTPDLAVKKEFLAVANLIQGLAGQGVSINNIADRYGLSENTRNAMISQLAYPELADDVFVLDTEEFTKSAAYATVELDNGGMLTAPTGQFDTCFKRELLNGNPNHVRFTTEGMIVDERIRGRK